MERGEEEREERRARCLRDRWFQSLFFFFFLRPSVAIDGREILTPFSPTTSSFSSSSSDSSPRISNRPFITRADASTILGYDSIQMQALFAFFFFGHRSLYIYIYTFLLTFRNVFEKWNRVRVELGFGFPIETCQRSTNFELPPRRN